ncbi:MAG: protein kinase domain-containing protein [Kofleriaceae bacterium]
MIGTTVGNYKILDRVSVGGMGTVFRGEHTLIGRIAAIKVLHPELSTNRDIVNRFFNEAKATTAILHPGIVEVFDFGYMPSGHAYLVMEFLDGVTLSQRMKLRGVMHEGEAALYLRGVCSALAAAHAKGIVHRDLKPDNIFLIPDLESPLGERSKLLDFGIAKLTDIGLANNATKTGAVMGTPTYMSPEQCKGTGDVDHRADLYSIGCILYELVSGRPPFVNFGAGELIGSHLFVQPDPVSHHAPGISRESEALIMALLDKQPERRIQSARELAQILTEIAQRFVAVPLGTPFDLTRPSIGAIPATGALAAQPPLVPQPPHLATPAPLSTPTPVPAMPTTLSGAASQSVVMPVPAEKSSCKVIAIGMAEVAIAAGGVLAAIGLTGGSDPQPATPAASPAVRVEMSPSSPAAGGGEAKPGEVKSGEAKPGEAKPGEAKPGEAKPGEVKPNEMKPGETKLGEATSAETKLGETKPGETKPGEAKPGEVKSAEAKPGEAKSGQTKPGSSTSEPKLGETKPGSSTAEPAGANANARAGKPSEHSTTAHDPNKPKPKPKQRPKQTGGDPLLETDL